MNRVAARGWWFAGALAVAGALPGNALSLAAAAADPVSDPGRGARVQAQKPQPPRIRPAVFRVIQRRAAPAHKIWV